MVTVSSHSKALNLVSQITGQRLISDNELSPSVRFMASLVTVLLGVANADTQVSEEEKQRIIATLYGLSYEVGNTRRLIHLMIKGVRETQLYTNIDALLTLTSSLSASEKLLLVSFSLGTAIADGHVNECENQYLQFVAQHLEVDLQHLSILEARFCQEEITNITALEEVRSLIDLTQFHGLDSGLLKAAGDISTILSERFTPSGHILSKTFAYAELDQFRERLKQLATAYSQLLKVVQDCKNKGIVSELLEAETRQALSKLSCRQFRVVVVGEFSQGKSTLLNALTGEEIQPVRVIPCSGTVTVLRHGTTKRVICRYKDGREEEIPVEDYQNKVSISEEAALGCVIDELAQSELAEVIYEHPNLSFCSSGVEIIDTPGLNEHPDRTAITQAVLKDADIVIFLTNASKPLTFEERNLLKELQFQLSGGQEGIPVENLFIAVNFSDRLEQQSDRQQVQQLVERFAYGSEPILSEKNRVHFISARSALNAALAGNENIYSQSFREFTRTLESFLTDRRGAIELKRSVTKYHGLIQTCLDGLQQAESVLDGKIKLSTEGQQQLIEQIGAAAGYETRLRFLVKQLKQEAHKELTKSWSNWLEDLRNQLATKKNNWHSSKGFFKPKEMAQDFASQFTADLQSEYKTWQTQSLDPILREKLKKLDQEICQILQELKQGLDSLEQEIKADFSKQFTVAVNALEPEIGNLFGALGMGVGLGVGGFGTAAMMAVQIGKFALFPVAGIGVAIAIVGTIIFTILDQQKQYEKIKDDVFKLSWENFLESQSASLGKILTSCDSIFDQQLEPPIKAIQQARFMYEGLLSQQTRYQKSTQVEQISERDWLTRERRELEKLNDSINMWLDE